MFNWHLLREIIVEHYKLIHFCSFWKAVCDDLHYTLMLYSKDCTQWLSISTEYLIKTFFLHLVVKTICLFIHWYMSTRMFYLFFSPDHMPVIFPIPYSSVTKLIPNSNSYLKLFTKKKNYYQSSSPWTPPTLCANQHVIKYCHHSFQNCIISNNLRCYNDIYMYV